MEVLNTIMAQMGLGDQVDQRQAQEEKLLNEVLRNERNNIEISRKQRGKKLKSRPTRSTLLALQHQALSEQVSVQSTDRLIVIAREYPPSDRAFADLKLIMLNDLLMETVHNDNYVVLRYDPHKFEANEKLTTLEPFLQPFVEQRCSLWLKMHVGQRTSCICTTSMSASTTSPFCPLARFWPFVHRITSEVLVVFTLYARIIHPT